MIRFIVRRFLWMLGVLFVVSAVTFFLMHQIPGGPFDREKPLPQNVIQNLEAKYHLNDPLWKQYVLYIGNISIPRITTGLATGDAGDDYLINLGLPGDKTIRWMNFGPSFGSTSRSVNDIFRENLPISIELGIYSLLVACGVGIPLGILSAIRRHSIYDYMGMGVAILGVSVPIITSGPILRYVVGVELAWLPPVGWGTWQQAIMPSFALGFAQSALLARLTRASLLQVLDEDYIRTARAKGLSERGVIGTHALKNSMIPVVTVLGPLFAALVTGTFVTERIFAVPGMGRYFVDSVNDRDYPVIMGTILLYAAFLVVANLLVDVIYAWLDPRIRYD